MYTNSRHCKVGAHQRKGKEGKGRGAKKRTRIEAQREKSPTPTLAIDAFIGDEEENAKQKKETERRTPTKLPIIIRSPPTTPMDHTVTLFF